MPVTLCFPNNRNVVGNTIASALERSNKAIEFQRDDQFRTHLDECYAIVDKRFGPEVSEKFKGAARKLIRNWFEEHTQTVIDRIRIRESQKDLKEFADGIKVGKRSKDDYVDYARCIERKADSLACEFKIKINDEYHREMQGCEGELIEKLDELNARQASLLEEEEAENPAVHERVLEISPIGERVPVLEKNKYRSLAYAFFAEPAAATYIAFCKHVIIPLYNGYNKSLGRLVNPPLILLYEGFNQVYMPVANHIEKFCDITQWSDEKLVLRMHQVNKVAGSCSLVSFGFGVASFFNPVFAIGSMFFSPLALAFSKAADRLKEIIDERELDNSAKPEANETFAGDTGDLGHKEHFFKEISRDLVRRFKLSGEVNEERFEHIFEYLENVRLGNIGNPRIEEIIEKLDEDVSAIPLAEFIQAAQERTNTEIAEYTRYERWGARASFISSLGTTTVGTIVFILSAFGIPVPPGVSFGILGCSTFSMASNAEIAYCGAKLKALERVQMNLAQLSEYLKEKV